MHSAPHPGKHHGRFYIVMITIVIGAIFALLLLNDSQSEFSVTGSTVGLFDQETGEAIDVAEGELFVEAEEQEKIQDLRTREVNVALTFDKVPIISQEAKIEDLEVHFTNAGTKIMINSDSLELNNLEDVRLKVKDFSGEIDVDGIDFSLQGMARKIDVNGMVFSAKDSLSLKISKVGYDYFFVDEIELKNVHLPQGNGQLSVADKLKYTLEQEEVNFYSFIGKMVVDEGAENSTSGFVTMEGVAKGTDISGALLNLDVR